MATRDRDRDRVWVDRATASFGDAVKSTLASRWRSEALARLGGEERLPWVPQIM